MFYIIQFINVRTGGLHHDSCPVVEAHSLLFLKLLPFLKVMAFPSLTFVNNIAITIYCYMNQVAFKKIRIIIVHPLLHKFDYLQKVSNPDL